MKELKNISSVYFLGIGGIGMSAVARYFSQKAVKVSGYDKTETSLTLQLQSEGIDVHYTDDVELADKDADIIVYTPAIPSSHSELNYYRSNNYTLLKRSDVLGMITADSYNICVAGTHGKTTTCAMTAHILRDSGFGCNAFLGGISANYNTNFWRSDNNVSVAEADEYDRSFLKLQPDIAVITAMDADHLDIYGSEKNMQDAFIEFTWRLRKGGRLIIKDSVNRIDEFTAAEMMTYSASADDTQLRVKNKRVEKGAYVFDAVVNDKTISDVTLNMGGMHNVENMLAAIGISVLLNIDDQKIKDAAASFSGVKRRFEFVIRNERLTMIDDYAHHPEELRALIAGAKDLFPGKKITIVFQPHLFSRTKDLTDGFAETLDLADEIMILPIYPARELPVKGVSSELIANKMKSKVKLISKEELIEYSKNETPELLITAGAGDIDAMVVTVKNNLLKN